MVERTLMSISVILPAYNEERYIGETLKSIKRANEFLLEREDVSIEIIVVDNDSTDATAKVALSLGARVIKESQHNVAKVRNAGARSANGNILVLIDADTVVPNSLLWRINEVMADHSCCGGAVDTDYRPKRYSVKLYLQLWRLLGKVTGMAQGSAQFCRKDIYVSLRGYDETLYMGEDVDFYWRLNRFAKRRNARVCFIKDIQVVPSTRRFDQWSLWRTLIWTNPLFILTLRRRKTGWKGWYDTVPR
jgi:glycosyltransferase involved in cell wall biosynthesis